jgi:hypothetical protein
MKIFSLRCQCGHGDDNYIQNLEGLGTGSKGIPYEQI